MANLIIVGMQWGDEGKGKIVDLICPAFDAVARYQGGHNAGHTVKFQDRHFALHLIPSGILHPGMQCVLGAGMVISPEAFFTELSRLQEAGIETEGRLHLASRATALLPPHVALDQAREEARGKHKIGTTSRGIGPAYESRASRVGLRLIDLLASDLDERLRALCDRVAAELRSLGAAVPFDLESLGDECRDWGERLRPLLAGTETLLSGWLDEGKALLFEGAQGALLDLSYGTYPYVTSSPSTAGGAATGTGVPPHRLDGAVGILKAYCSRVGEGPFPSELHEETGEYLRRRGNEFGTTTGRPRRCGWLDTVAARYAQRLNGVDGIALTKLDVLDDLEEIRVCTAYRLAGEELTELPARLEDLEAVEPVYEVLPGWKETTVGVTDFAALPARAQDYVRFIEERVGAPVVVVSTGPRREETLLRRSPVLERLFGDRLASLAVR